MKNLEVKSENYQNEINVLINDPIILKIYSQVKDNPIATEEILADGFEIINTALALEGYIALGGKKATSINGPLNALKYLINKNRQ